MIPPEPGPDPPEPSSTYKLLVSLLYTSDSESGLPCDFVLSYREHSDSAWVPCDSLEFTSKSSGATDSIELGNIPAGCHSVQLTIHPGSSDVDAYIKTHNDTVWGPSISYGSGNEGWNQNVQTDVDIRVVSD